ncbi:11S globulin seed storage protein Jug r 4-like [Salvia divinorum]|uniref:11S globulin seed storage protein Jug r 4-like n=1 Tax=Salvia divinorum TaxID=28513 RepID=A0ABD1G9H9_SALDI
MGKLSLSVLSFLLLLGLGYAIIEQQGECQISNIDAREPSYSVRSEGGQTEFWDNQNNDLPQRPGSRLRRPRQGNLRSSDLSGCAETFESGQQQQFSQEERSQRFRDDRHQKVEEFQQGDVIAVRAGDAHWVYNDGDQELVVVVFHHNSNYANQLDQNPRSFFLAGNPGNEQEEEQYRRLRGSKRGQEAQSELGNVFRGFDDELLAEAFGVDVEDARKLRGQNDQRGHIIRAEKSIQLIQPHRSRQEQEQERRHNGLEETFCSARVKENLDRPSRADFYNPRAGRFSTLNSFNLPILRFLQLSAARGVLHRNAIFSPHWYTNAHTLIYATRGASRVQIVNHRGHAVFDGQLRQGQVLVVPQNFAVVKQAADQGFEWVAFNTNDNAAINTLSGRTSAIRGLPVDVVANAYQLSREEAQRIKFSRQETLIFNANNDSP